MKKLSVKKIIEFRSKSDRAKKNFATDIKLNKPKPQQEEGGGDYWISSVSAIARAYRENSLQIIHEKIQELQDKFKATKHLSSRGMYKKNIDILRSYETFDFKRWLPDVKIKFLKNYRIVLTLKDLLFEVGPHHVFSFIKNQKEEIGAIWMIAKKDGYNKEELGMFTDALYRYLKNQYGKEYLLNPKYCIAADLVSNYDINYAQLEKGEVTSLLSKTIDDIKKFM